MQFIRHRLRSFTWLALFAMLGLALAPSVSRALDADPASNPWAQICSTPAAAAAGAPALPGPLAHAAHCPLCGHGAGPVGLPPAAVVVLDVPAHRAIAAPPARVAVAAAPAWTAAQPRAPPAFS